MISEEQIEKSLDDIFSCIREIKFLGKTYFLTPFNEESIQKEIQEKTDEEYLKRVLYSSKIVDELEEILFETEKVNGKISFYNKHCCKRSCTRTLDRNGRNRRI